MNELAEWIKFNWKCGHKFIITRKWFLFGLKEIDLKAKWVIRWLRCERQKKLYIRHAGASYIPFLHRWCGEVLRLFFLFVMPNCTTQICHRHIFVAVFQSYFISTNILRTLISKSILICIWKEFDKTRSAVEGFLFWDSWRKALSEIMVQSKE